MLGRLVGVAAEHDAYRFLSAAKTAKAGVWIVHPGRDPHYMTDFPRLTGRSESRRRRTSR